MAVVDGGRGGGGGGDGGTPPLLGRRRAPVVVPRFGEWKKQDEEEEQGKKELPEATAEKDASDDSKGNGGGGLKGSLFPKAILRPSRASLSPRRSPMPTKAQLTKEAKERVGDADVEGRGGGSESGGGDVGGGRPAQGNYSFEFEEAARRARRLAAQEKAAKGEGREGKGKKKSDRLSDDVGERENDSGRDGSPKTFNHEFEKAARRARGPSTGDRDASCSSAAALAPAAAATAAPREREGHTEPEGGNGSGAGAISVHSSGRETCGMAGVQHQDSGATRMPQFGEWHRGGEAKQAPSPYSAASYSGAFDKLRANRKQHKAKSHSTTRSQCSDRSDLASEGWSHRSPPSEAASATGQSEDVGTTGFYSAAFNQVQTSRQGRAAATASTTAHVDAPVPVNTVGGSDVRLARQPEQRMADGAEPNAGAAAATAAGEAGAELRGEAAPQEAPWQDACDALVSCTSAEDAARIQQALVRKIAMERAAANAVQGVARPTRARIAGSAKAHGTDRADRNVGRRLSPNIDRLESESPRGNESGLQQRAGTESSESCTPRDLGGNETRRARSSSTGGGRAEGVSCADHPTHTGAEPCLCSRGCRQEASPAGPTISETTGSVISSNTHTTACGATSSSTRTSTSTSTSTFSGTSGAGSSLCTSSGAGPCDSASASTNIETSADVRGHGRLDAACHRSQSGAGCGGASSTSPPVRCAQPRVNPVLSPPSKKPSIPTARIPPIAISSKVQGPRGGSGCFGCFSTPMVE